MPDAQSLDHLLHLLADGLRAAGDDVAVVHELLPGERRELGERVLGQLREGSRLERLDGAVAGRVGEARVDVQAAVEEVADVLGVELLGLAIGVGDADDLRERRAIGRRVLPLGGDALPEAVEELLPPDVAGEREVGVVVVEVGAEVPGLDRAAAGNVDRRVRLLDGLRPAVHVAELRVLAVEGEGLVLLPRPHDELVRLVVLVAGERRDLPVAEVRVHRRADREAGDEPPAGDHVQHGELLRHADGRVVERDRVADDADGRPRRPARQPGGDDVRRRHEPVAVLVVLVHADAVEAERVGVFELVHVLVVHEVPLTRVVELARNVDPHRAVLLPEVVGQIRPGHQVEPRESHGALLRALGCLGRLLSMGERPQVLS